MLKFFRKYNKWILGVGGSLLMIVFLIQPVLDMFRADPMEVAIGTFDGGELTRRDLMSAESDLNVLREFSLMLDPDFDPEAGNNSSSNDPLRWALILKDAERLGLSASLYEVDQLKLEMGRSDADVEMIASRINATPGYVASGDPPMADRAAVQGAAGGAGASVRQRAGFDVPPDRAVGGHLPGLVFSYGSSRMSRPLVEHFLQDQGAEVMGRAVMISAERLLDEVPAPSDAEVQAQFDEYKDDLPGRGEPYGFGYRVPDRIKLEYLSISMDQARQAVKVTEADALAHYREYPERFTSAGETAPRSYEAARDDVIRDLTDQLAFELVEKMAKSAFGALYEDTRGMAKEDDYRVVGDTELTPMRQIADRLEEEYGFRPDIRNAGGAWVAADAFTTLPGIGQSRLSDNINVDFAQFVQSTKELEPESDNSLLPRRLQVGIVTTPMISMEGSRHVFRLTAAEPSREPESLDEVRDKVTSDAHLLAAYKKLLTESDDWLKQAVDGGLDAVAEAADTSVIPLPPTPRRVPLPNGLLVLPPLPSIGQSDAFIEAYFGTANAARDAGGVDQAPADVTTGVVGVDGRLSLAVYQVDSYQPMTREMFKLFAQDPRLPIMIDTTILIESRIESPLSLKALEARLNFDDGVDEDEGEKQDENQETQEMVKAGN